VSLWTDPVSTWGRSDVSWAGAPVARTFLVSELRGPRSGGSTLSFPMRQDASGRIVTVPQLSPRHAAEIVGHVLSCQPGERGLAPGYGLQDQAGMQVVSGDLVASTVVACEPDVQVTDVVVDQAVDGRVRVKVSARWAPSVKVV
jgi:phage baseplate assembly protein W